MTLLRKVWGGGLVRVLSVLFFGRIVSLDVVCDGIDGRVLRMDSL